MLVLGIISPTTLFAKDVLSCNGSAIETGEVYNVRGAGINVRKGPGINFDKIVNETATSMSTQTQYVSIDSSVTVLEECTQGKWSKIQVTMPKYLSHSHRGWVASKFLTINHERKNSKWKKVDLFDYIEIIRILGVKGIKGCGSIPKVYQYQSGNVFNVYCDPANKWHGVNISSNRVFEGADNFPYK
jgi:hypothetical protein